MNTFVTNINFLDKIVYIYYNINKHTECESCFCPWENSVAMDNFGFFLYFTLDELERISVSRSIIVYSLRPLLRLITHSICLLVL